MVGLAVLALAAVGAMHSGPVAQRPEEDQIWKLEAEVKMLRATVQQLIEENKALKHKIELCKQKKTSTDDTKERGQAAETHGMPQGERIAPKLVVHRIKGIPLPAWVHWEAVVPIEDGELTVTFTAPVVYLAGKPRTYTGFLHVEYKAKGEKYGESPTASFFRMGGKPQKVIIESTDEEKLVITEYPKLGRSFEFKAAGSVDIKLCIGARVLYVPVKIKDIPVEIGSPASRLIEAFGFPDAKERHFISWPEVKTYDEIIYNPSAATRIVSPEHWRYDKYPHAVFSVMDGRFYEIGINRYPTQQIENETDTLTP